MSDYGQYFAVMEEIKKGNPHLPERPDLIAAFTDDEKTSLTELIPGEYKAFLKWLETTFKHNGNHDENSPENRMRRNIIAILKHEMGYSMKRIEEWCVKYGKFSKGLNAHSYDELVALVTQVKQFHKHYIKDLNKA